MHRAQTQRLEHYLLRLRELRAAGCSTATSEELAQVVGVSSSRVRQDMMRLGMVGKPRSGYLVDELERLIHEALDLYRPKTIVLVGCGNLGSALVNSGIWDETGFQVRAAFDNNPNKVGGRVSRIQIQHIDKLPAFLRRERVDAACVTVPASAAQAVVDTLVAGGVRGIWNFASADVRVPSGVALENQRLEQGLMTLSFLLKGTAPPGRHSDPVEEEPPDGGYDERPATDRGAPLRARA